MISETLLKFDFEKVEPVPWLAESFEISPDGTFIDLTIRKGIKFHEVPTSTLMRQSST